MVQTKATKGRFISSRLSRTKPDWMLAWSLDAYKRRLALRELNGQARCAAAAIGPASTIERDVVARTISMLRHRASQLDDRLNILCDKRRAEAGCDPTQCILI
jgi:hypothetical protein